MSAYETEYFRLRSVSERKLAVAAAIPEVAAVHEWLAQRYDALAENARFDAPMTNNVLRFPSVADKGVATPRVT